VLRSTVTNHVPGAGGTVTFTDIVPSRLKVEVAAATGGSCSVAGQSVTCAISGLAVGQSATITVVVTPSTAGNYANSVAVAGPSGVADGNSANNTAQATLAVRASVSAKCVVPSLRGVASRTAKTVLRDLGCKVKTKTSHSNSVLKGSVIKTAPGAGTYAYQRQITLIISSGRKKHHK
jgi:plastocyanin domain-containing protein